MQISRSSFSIPVCCPTNLDRRFTALRSLFAAFLVLAFSASSDAGSLTIQWDLPLSGQVAGFVISYGLESRVYTEHRDVGRIFQYVVKGLEDRTRYCFAVRAYDAQHVLSEHSVEVCGMTATPAPVPPAVAEIALYAPWARVRSGNWAPSTSPGAAGGVSMKSADRGWSALNRPLAAPNHYFELTFEAQAGAEYNVWLRLRADGNSTLNDAVWVQFSDSLVGGSPGYRIGTDSGLLVRLQRCAVCGVAEWGWQNTTWELNQKTSVSFATGGPHTIRVQTAADGIEIDQIVLSPVTYLSAAPGAAVDDRTILSATATPPQGPISIAVTASEELQPALDAAAPGDTILLKAGITFVGNFVLPQKAGNSDAYITLRSSTADHLLPAAGVRITPAYAPKLAKLRSPNGQPALSTAARAHHYRVQFVEFLANANGVGTVIALGDGTAAQHSLDLVPHALVLDRIYVHGEVVYGQTRAIALNSESTTIADSYVSEIKGTVESQAIAGWNGPGPYVISNNYLEAAGQNVVFGAVRPSIPDLVPADIRLQRNHIVKQLVWKGQQRWRAQSLLELKNAARVVIDGNRLENSWQAGMSSYAIVFSAVNTDPLRPWSAVRDVTFTNNVVNNVSSGIFIARDAIRGDDGVRGITIRNNLFDNLSSAVNGGMASFLGISGGSDVTVDHNTVWSDGFYGVLAATWPAERFVFTNNILVDRGGVLGGADGMVGTKALAKWFASGLFLGGIYIGGRPNAYPVVNYYPQAIGEVGFANWAAGDYRLGEHSIYRRGGIDGKDPGVDFTQLAAAQP